MKLGGTRFSFILAFATAIILLIYPAFAQEPAHEKRASDEANANKIAATKEPVIKAQDLARAVRKAASPSAATTINFVPADIFNYTMGRKAVETRHPATAQDQAVSQGAGRGDVDDSADLAKKLANPIEPLISVPFQSNFDFWLGADREGWRYTMNLQPVIPIQLSKDLNLISRTTLPIIEQDGISASTEQTGLGDMLQSFFISPSKTGPFIWGAGPALLIPTATDTRMGAGKFGIGPTLVVLKQQGGWTYGAMTNHVWSVAGHRDRADVSSTFIQPFVSYTTRSAWTYSLNTESTYDWVGKEWSTPVHLTVTKLVRFGRQPVSVGGGVRCWAATFPGGPQGCGVRVIFTPVIPGR